MRKWAMTVAVVLAVAGCSGTSGDTSPPDVTVTVEATAEPSPEPTGAEPTQSQQTKPSIELASLPVGGVPDDGSNCNPISWLAGEIPAGVTIRLGTPAFDPPGIFEVDPSGCQPGVQACTGLEWTAQSTPQCWVGFRQIATEGTVSLIIPAVATCDSDTVCNTLKNLGGSQITLTALPPETPLATPSSG
ncbi:hypothetical protein ACWF0M_03810 [Kribbella sp. NPDC055110]